MLIHCTGITRTILFKHFYRNLPLCCHVVLPQVLIVPMNIPAVLLQDLIVSLTLHAVLTRALPTLGVAPLVTYLLLLKMLTKSS